MSPTGLRPQARGEARGVAARPCATRSALVEIGDVEAVARRKPARAVRRPASRRVGAGAGARRRAARACCWTSPLVQPRRQGTPGGYASERSGACSGALGITTVYVTHESGRKRSPIADRVVLMSAGRASSQAGKSTRSLPDAGDRVSPRTSSAVGHAPVRGAPEPGALVLDETTQRPALRGRRARGPVVVVLRSFRSQPSARAEPDARGPISKESLFLGDRWRATT